MTKPTIADLARRILEIPDGDRWNCDQGYTIFMATAIAMKNAGFDFDDIYFLLSSLYEAVEGEIKTSEVIIKDMRRE